MTRTGPRREIIGDPVRLVVGASDDHERCRGRHDSPPRGQVRSAGGRGHAKHARIRLVGPKGVDERCDAAVTAARGGHAAPW
jgi:hypothetical protein